MAEVRAAPSAADRVRLIRRGILFMVGAMLASALMDTIAKWLARDYEVAQVVWARYFFHTLTVMALFGGFRLRAIMATRRPGLQAIRSLLMLIATMAFFTALKYLPLAESVAIGYASPFFVTALSVVFLGEKVGIRRWTAIVVGFTGVLVIIRPGFADVHWAAFLPLVMASCFALYQILTRITSRVDDTRTNLFYASAAATVVLTFAMPFVWTPPDLAGWGLMVLVGVCGGMCHFLIIKGYEIAPASILSPFVYASIVWTTALGFFVFGDFPDGWAWLGTAIVIASGLYIFRRETRRAG
ncbi:MAG: DMT family transporter [Rhodospirillales bacterium]